MHSMAEGSVQIRWGASGSLGSARKKGKRITTRKTINKAGMEDKGRNQTEKKVEVCLYYIDLTLT